MKQKRFVMHSTSFKVYNLIKTDFHKLLLNFLSNSTNLTFVNNNKFDFVYKYNKKYLSHTILTAF